MIAIISLNGVVVSHHMSESEHSDCQIKD